jgi:hypothetical protein
MFVPLSWNSAVGDSERRSDALLEGDSPFTIHKDSALLRFIDLVRIRRDRCSVVHRVSSRTAERDRTCLNVACPCVGDLWKIQQVIKANAREFFIDIPFSKEGLPELVGEVSAIHAYCVKSAESEGVVVVDDVADPQELFNIGRVVSGEADFAQRC